MLDWLQNLLRGIRLWRLLNFLIFIALGFLVFNSFSTSHDSIKNLIFLPGTQPGNVDTLHSDGPDVCQQCHSSSSTIRPVTIHKDWSGSMMANSARDPIFYAALAIANKYSSNSGNNVGEFCIRCHSPTGWLAGRSEDISGSSLRGTDLHGVQCDYCHRSVDPLNPDTSVHTSPFPVPGYGNGMHVVQKLLEPKRGPYSDASSAHEVMADSFQRQSQLCGVCHDVSNPFLTQDQTRILQSPHTYAPLERTFSEWLMSWYATQGIEGTCQGCHMRRSSGYGCTFGPLRSDLAQHDLTGGNTFVQDILPEFWEGLDTVVLEASKQRTIETLQRAADLEVVSFRLDTSVVVRVRITNLTGHKLPTGYPDGRRMWISINGRDSQGNTIYSSGLYDHESAILYQDEQLKVYEAIQGMTDSMAQAHQLPSGASFHFALNDTILFDNRIPPKGFTNANFASRLASPVGVSYADSQYWDDTEYILPSNVSQVTAGLYYQTISREYIEFLRDHNVGNTFDWNSWGQKLYDAWEKHGKSQPVQMETKTVTVSDSPVSVTEPPTSLPFIFGLEQNYPNPFNPGTEIGFQISEFSLVTLKVYDVAGREVATILQEERLPGSYTVHWNADGIPSGIYFSRLTSGTQTQTRKIVLIR